MNDHEIRIRFGAAVKEARTELGLSIAQLAREVGFDQRSSICQLERGINGVVMPKALRLVEYLGIDVAEILGGPDDG